VGAGSGIRPSKVKTPVDGPLTWPRQRTAIRRLLADRLVNFDFDRTVHGGSFISLLGTTTPTPRSPFTGHRGGPSYLPAGGRSAAPEAGADPTLGGTAAPTNLGLVTREPAVETAGFRSP
jgi:hypothetical protein